MKNPLNPFKFWKRNDPEIVSAPTAQSAKPARAASVPAHAAYQTSILKDFIAAITRKENPVVLDLGPVIGSNIEFFLNLGIKVYMEDFLAAYSNPKYSILGRRKPRKYSSSTTGATTPENRIARSNATLRWSAGQCLKPSMSVSCVAHFGSHEGEMVPICWDTRPTANDDNPKHRNNRTGNTTYSTIVPLRR